MKTKVRTWVTWAPNIKWPVEITAWAIKQSETSPVSFGFSRRILYSDFVIPKTGGGILGIIEQEKNRNNVNR